MAKKKARNHVEEFLALPDAEKNRIAAEFDKEMVMDTFRPLSAEQRRLWAKAKRRRGRPVVGKGVKVISLSMEIGLLKDTDAWAKRQGISRSQLVAKGLRKVIGK